MAIGDQDLAPGDMSHRTAVIPSVWPVSVSPTGALLTVSNARTVP